MSSSTQASKSGLISTEEHDYLDSDPAIRGQKYVCLSFVSPEDAIKNKEAFFFKKYLETFSQDLTTLFENSRETFKENLTFVDALHGLQDRYSHLFKGDKLQEEYDFFKGTHADHLETEFLEKNDFQTTIRGLKVRGCYETFKEADIRAQVLKRMDGRFNVFIAEVGCWCPWSPNPEELENQEYAEAQLNTLVKKYYDNQHEKDQFFQERKEHLRTKALEENKQKQRQDESNEKDENFVIVNPPDVNATDVQVSNEEVKVLEDPLEGEDPWMRRKREQSNVTTE